MTANTIELGRVIKSAEVRRGLYLAYVSLALVVGALHAAWGVVDVPRPVILDMASAAVAYLAIPFAGLAIANTPAGKHAAAEPEHEVIPEDD